MEPEVLAANEPRGDESCESRMTLTKPNPVRRTAFREQLAVCIEPPRGERERDDESDEQHHRETGLPDVALEEGQASSEEITQRAKESRPRDSAEHVVECKDAVGHLGRSGEQRGPGPKERDESAEEDGLGSVLVEERANSLELGFVEMDDASVPFDEGDPAQPTYPVARGVADNPACCGDRDYPPDREMSKGGEGAGSYQNRFTRQRNAEALYGNEEEYDCIAVGFNESNDRAMHGGNLLDEDSQGNLAAHG